MQHAVAQPLRIGELNPDRSPTPGRTPPLARVLSVSDSGNRFEVELRFVRGTLYCCAEPGCFLPTFNSDWWRRFREHLREVSDREPPPFVVTVHGIVEEGTELEVLRPFGKQFSNAYAYSMPAAHEADCKS